MPYQIRIRRDTTSNWTSNDPILALGEMAFDTTTNEIRVGDGTSVWSALTPIRADNNAVSLRGIDIESGTPADGEVLQYNASLSEWVYATVSGGGGSGTVTSVGLTMPTDIFGVSPTTITTSGSFSVTLNNQAINTVFAGPSTGSNAAPTFRALTTNDLPNIATASSVIGEALTSITTATNDLSSGSNQLLYLSGAKTFSRTDFTSTARTLLDDTSTSAMRTTLGLAISTDVQAYDAGLQSIAGLTTAPDTMLYTTALDTYAVTTLTAFGRSLIDDVDAVAARVTLGFDTVDSLATSPQAKATVKEIKAGVVLAKGEVVYVSGATGDNLNVLKAQANTEATSSKTIGIMIQAAANVGDLAYVMTEGLLTGINTSSEVAGTAVWLSPSTAGGWTTTKPSSPNHLVFLGWIVKVNASTGSIYVKVANGQELDELHDVQISTLANNDILQWDTSTSPATWKNKTLSSAGIAASSHPHGNLTNDGKLGTTAGKLVLTGANGAIYDKAIGSASSFLRVNSGGTDHEYVALPGLTNTQVLYQSSNTFAGSSNFVFDATNKRLKLGAEVPGDLLRDSYPKGSIELINNAGYSTILRASVKEPLPPPGPAYTPRTRTWILPDETVSVDSLKFIGGLETTPNSDTVQLYWAPVSSLGQTIIQGETPQEIREDIEIGVKAPDYILFSYGIV